MSEDEFYNIQQLIDDLNICLKKFKESTNEQLIPLICRKWDLHTLKFYGIADYDLNDFIELSDGQILAIKNWKESEENFSLLDIRTFKDKESINC